MATHLLNHCFLAVSFEGVIRTIVSGIVNNIVPIAWTILVYWAISKPLRSNERARFLLDVIQSALEQGIQLETYIVDMSNTRDRALGVKFHLLAARIQSGMTLMDALEATPGLVPAQILATLKCGASVDNIGAVIPACHKLLRDGVSQTRASINYQAVFALILSPAVLVIAPFVQVKVLPVFEQIAGSFNTKMPALSVQAAHWTPFLFALNLLLAVLLYIATVLFLGGPRFPSWIESGLWPLSEWIYARIPWRRKRLQRDFSAVLAMLLDGGVSEARAVALAASATANRTFIQRGKIVVGELQKGARLSDAITLLDDTGEFQWRLANSAHHSCNFQRALEGWQLSLDAKAFQQEQAAAQAISTGFVIVNACTAFLVAASVFVAINSLSSMAIQSMQ